MIKTEAGEKMKQENPVEEKQDINQDGEYEAWEQARQEAIKTAQKFEPETPEMNMGGLMNGGMGVIIGIEEESGNEIPAGSKPEEVADDIPAMLSEGEYVVPADVVRWHGVKTLEALRCEAKMGMGLMAQDGRIAEVETDDKGEEPEYDIEEKDKPKVEQADVEVVHAADGVDLASPATPTGGPYYGYRVVFDPQANRYVFRPVDPETQQPVTTEAYDPAQSTRYTPEALLGSVYGEDQTVECPDGFYYDEDSGTCMPEEVAQPMSVTQPDSGGGDGPQEQAPQVQGLAGLASYQLAEALGPNAEYAGKPVDALTRATTPTEPPVTGFFANTMIGAGINAISNTYDSVGAHRAMLQRGEDLSATALGLDPDALPQTFNLSFNPETASYTATTSSRISELQSREDGTSWASNYTHTDINGNDIDPFSSDEDFDAALEAIDNEFSSLTAVSGGPQYTGDSGGDGGGVTAAESQAAADTYGTTAGSQQSDMLAEQDRGLTDDGDGDSGGDSKIVCTAMNSAYGFGSFRQTIWLKHSVGMTKEHELGYHTLFQPLVNYAYNTEKVGHKSLRSVLEHIARRRTADIWKQRHGKRDAIGAIERAVLEPICYITGWIKKRIS